MQPIPLIVGFGGVSAAGRSAFNSAYKLVILDKLKLAEQRKTLAALASLMGLVSYKNKQFYKTKDNQPISLSQIQTDYSDYIKKNSLIRKLNFQQSSYNIAAQIDTAHLKHLKIATKEKILSKDYNLAADGRSISSKNPEASAVELLIKGYKENKVNVGGQVPTGFDVSKLYHSIHHPKYLQYAIFGVSDALHSVGIEWEELKKQVALDKIGVYCGSCLGGIDSDSMGGLLQSAHKGERTSSKMLAFSMMNMISDFINAYVLGNIGYTSSSVGACATFLYNLHNAVRDIQSGKIKLAIVGSSEAPITNEIIEGYRVMSALADDAKLAKLNGGKIDYTSACRPFGDNCGFVLAEGSQFIVLFSDDLALQTGAKIYSAVGDVYICADGYKGSISKPGIGNYVTFSKATALAKAILGSKGLQNNTYIQAHGTGTPQNRVSESHILNETAKAFGIKDWKVAAIKTYLGHSTGPAAGDQLMACLGAWATNCIAGIKNTPKIADDVFCSNLNILLENEMINDGSQQACLINSKGFGGNNSTALFLSPNFAMDLLSRKYQKKIIKNYLDKNNYLLKKLQKIEKKYYMEISYQFILLRKKK